MIELQASGACYSWRLPPPRWLDGYDDGSCPDDIATTSSPTSPHCFMSQGDTKVSNNNVVDHVDSYDELASRLASMTMFRK